MSRQRRIEFPDALYHVTSRGTGRQRIFLEDGDRLTFLGILEGAVGRFGWLCHAYCLMDNHYHLMVETPRPNLSRGMRALNGVYAQTFNARHHRSGHLFGGRYKATLVERQSYLLELCRYVVLNPVRAGLPPSRLSRWRWSSYRATAGLEPAPPFLQTGRILDQFHTDRRRAQRAYSGFVRDGLGANPWQHARATLYLGDDSFLRPLQRCPATLVEIPRAQREPLRCTLEELLRREGDSAILSAYRNHGYRIREIAAVLGVHYSTISRRLKAAEASERQAA